MPFLHAVQGLDMSAKSREELLRELTFLRTELDNIRSQMVVLLAKLDDDGTVTDTNYEALCAPAASVFTKL